MSDVSTSDEMDNQSGPVTKKRKFDHNMVDGSIILVELNNFMWVGFNLKNTSIHLLNMKLIKMLMYRLFYVLFSVNLLFMIIYDLIVCKNIPNIKTFYIYFLSCSVGINEICCHLLANYWLLSLYWSIK